MPGEDVADWARFVLGELDVPFVPELPARGAHAAMIGRTLALLDGLDADLQPAGWRLGVGSGVDHRRARSLLAQDLDTLEEIGSDHDGPLKQQLAGPWTLASAVELGRGDKLLADHGARRDLAESLASGLADHLRDMRRRFSRSELIVQIDEPALPAVLAARVPTMSGFGRHRSIDASQANAHLRLLVDVITAAGATPVVHVCAADVPVALLREAGFTAIAFDLALVRPGEDWAETLEAGVDLWLGAGGASAGAIIDQVTRFLHALGHEPENVRERMVIAASCGLAGHDPVEARRSLGVVGEVARRFAAG